MLAEFEQNDYSLFLLKSSEISGSLIILELTLEALFVDFKGNRRLFNSLNIWSEI